MADGLSVAASVAGLVQIADVVVRRGYRYIREVKNAEKSVEQLIDEVNKLSGVLHSLKNVAERCEDDKMEIDPTAQIHHIEACLKTLQLVDTHLEHSNPATKTAGIDSIQSKLKWPLNKSKAKELMLEVEKHKSVMSLAMTASSMSALLVLLERQENLRDNVMELKHGIEMDRAQRVEVEINAERRKWLDWLSPIKVQKWQDSNIALRQPGTGIWFTDGPEFREWLSIEHSKLWIYGIPGAGKTILMASAIQEALMHTDPSRALAYFYCDYKDKETHSPILILGSLAKQIAVQHEGCFKRIGELYKCHFHQTPRGGKIEDSLCTLIGDLSRIFSSVMIIIDGLDEVSMGRSGVTHLLQSLNTPSNHIKTLFASRKEVDLEHPLQDYRHLSISAMSSDLRLYVASEIAKRTNDKWLRIRSPDLKEHIMRTLVEKADGMFRWVACQMDYLCECTNDRERREALDKLPPDLPSSYERILERINNSPNKSNQRLVARALEWIMFAERPLQTQQLLEALAINEGDDDIYPDARTTEDELLHWGSSLLRRRKDGGLELAHFTVAEFIQSLDRCNSPQPQFKPYSTCAESANIKHAISCLTYLTAKTFSNIQPRDRADMSEISENHRFLRYAAVYWAVHAHNHMDLPCIQNLTRRLFNPVSTNQLALYRCFQLGGFYILKISSGILNKNALEYDKRIFDDTCDNTNPLHWAASQGLVEICAWLLEQGLSASQMSWAGTPMNCALLGHRAFLGGQISAMTKWGGFFKPFPEGRQRHLVVEIFLKNGALPNTAQSSAQTYSPLSVAVLCADEDMWSVLLAAGAKFSAFNCKAIEVWHEPGSTDLRGKIFTHAAEDISIVQPEAHCVLFKTAFESVVFGRKDCGKALKIVLQYLSSHSDAFEWANSLTLKFKNQVDYASLPNEFVCFYCLLESRQKDLQSTAPFPSWLRELVVCAVREGKVDFINSLLESVPSICLSFEDKSETLLHTAVLNLNLQGLGNDMVMVELLLRAGLKSSAQDLDGETPLHYAAKLGRLEVFELLMTSSDAENALNLQDQEGRTAYERALVCSHTSIVEFIDQYRQPSRIPAEMEDVQMPGPGCSEGELAETRLKRMPSIEEDEEASSTKRQKSALSVVHV